MCTTGPKNFLYRATRSGSAHTLSDRICNKVSDTVNDRVSDMVCQGVLESACYRAEELLVPSHTLRFSPHLVHEGVCDSEWVCDRVSERACKGV